MTKEQQKEYLKFVQDLRELIDKHSVFKNLSLGSIMRICRRFLDSLLTECMNQGNLFNK